MPYQTSLPGVSVSSHSKLGEEFERDLIATHHLYEVTGIAKIDRHPSEWEFIGWTEYNNLLANPKTKPLVALTGNDRPMKRKATNVDFSGVAKKRGVKLGIAIKFDAKMCKEERIPLGNFARHQVDNLCSSAKCGAITGFMVNLYTINRVFFVPAEFVRKKMDKNFGKRRASAGDGSISLEELKRFAVEIPYSIRLVDWHTVLIK